MNEETPFNVYKCPCGGLLVPMDEISEFGVHESNEMYVCQKCSAMKRKVPK